MKTAEEIILELRVNNGEGAEAILQGLTDEEFSHAANHIGELPDPAARAIWREGEHRGQ